LSVLKVEDNRLRMILVEELRVEHFNARLGIQNTWNSICLEFDMLGIQCDSYKVEDVKSRAFMQGLE
jgi:hypothetical protein